MVDAPELSGVQALITEAIVEGLAVAVLPRLARLDVVGGGTLGFEPLGELEGDEFRSIVEYAAMDRGKKRRESSSWVIP